MYDYWCLLDSGCFKTNFDVNIHSILVYNMYLFQLQWADKVKELRTEVGLLTIFMKKLNRIEKIRNRNSREEVTKKRQQVDVSQLQVQNLMCEIQHLNREVDKCLCFK